MGGWVKPQLGFFFLGGGNIVFFVLFFSLYMFPIFFFLMDRREGGFCLDNPSFSRIFGFFLT